MRNALKVITETKLKLEQLMIREDRHQDTAKHIMNKWDKEKRYWKRKEKELKSRKEENED